MKTVPFALGIIIISQLSLTIISNALTYDYNVPKMDYPDYGMDYVVPENCICVPYYQCKEDFSGLLEDGVNIMDIRISSSSQFRPLGQQICGDEDVCCPIECGRVYNDLTTAAAPPVRNPSFAEVPLARQRLLFPLQYRLTDHSSNSGNRQRPVDNRAQFGEFPWMLGILQDRMYKCGASLIHPQVAVTAAHCVVSDGIARGPLKVRAGEWNWESNNEPLSHQDRMVKKVIMHSRFHAESLRNDIALLILDAPFALSAHVGITCVATPTYPNSFTAPPSVHPAQAEPAKQCVVSGWGKNSYNNGIYQATLKKMYLPLVPHQRCQQSLRNARLGPYFQLHRSFMCAGGEQNKDACKGDGGSPLVCSIPGATNRYEQVGIVSWGLTCGARSTPGVYVNLAMFSAWIDMHMTANNFDTTVYRRKII